MEKLKQDIKDFLIKHKYDEYALIGKLTDYCFKGELSIPNFHFMKGRTAELKVQREAVWDYFTNIVDVLADLQLPKTDSYIYSL